jgi:hypothetical protein
MFNWFRRKKETRAQQIRRELSEFNQHNLPMEFLPELDVPMTHTPPLGHDLNIPYLLGSVIPKQRDRLIKERETILRRLTTIDRNIQMLTDLETVANKAP